MKRARTLIVLSMFFVLGTAVTATAQPEENGGDPPLNDAPLDGGVSILIAAGVGYGAKKVHDSRKNKRTNSK